jgi:hypothetical protein
VLDLTRELDEWQTYRSPREARAAMRRRYQEDRWLGQKFYPILIVEKDTMEPVCRPIAQRWQMPFASSCGYSSLKLQHDVAEMLKHRYAKTGQVAVILFVSDLDPSGLDLERSWREALENFGVVYRFVRIGLTRDQVQTHDLERLGIAVKPSDSRSSSYITQYGNRCWRLTCCQPPSSSRRSTPRSRAGPTPSCGSGATARYGAPANCCDGAVDSQLQRPPATWPRGAHLGYDCSGAIITRSP